MHSWINLDCFMQNLWLFMQSWAQNWCLLKVCPFSIKIFFLLNQSLFIQSRTQIQLTLKLHPFWILDITRFLLFKIESKIGRRFSWIFLNFKLNLLKLLFQICKVWAVYAKLNHRRLSLTLYLGVETFNFKAESSDKTIKESTCLHIFLVKLDCSNTSGSSLKQEPR